MRLYTLKSNCKYELAVSFCGNDNMYLLRENGLDFVDMQNLIESWSPEIAQKLEALKDSGISIKDKEFHVCAPIMKPRQDIICLGINYEEHATESASFSEKFACERPKTIYFSKRCNYAPGTGETIPAHEDIVNSLDYEVELAAIIGKDTRSASIENALDYIFGYTIINDVSARNLQTAHTQWYLGKSLDGFAPMGPCIVTADEIPDPQTLSIKCFVNNELRQNSHTSQQIQTVAGAISELSQGMTLQAGTIIATGTPAGVGLGFQPPKFLKKGDDIRCEIEKIGILENKVL